LKRQRSVAFSAFASTPGSKACQIRLPQGSCRPRGARAGPVCYLAWVSSDVRNGVVSEGNDGVRRPLGGLHGRGARGRIGAPGIPSARGCAAPARDSSISAITRIGPWHFDTADTALEQSLSAGCWLACECFMCSHMPPYAWGLELVPDRYLQMNLQPLQRSLGAVSAIRPADRLPAKTWRTQA
jgi:hypothetical protein